ncbi:MAG: ATP phosphoribosyltransferase regulatory subunit [Lachnospiraceae bacterium]|nr:ATP phosphoribosyltransferase regulatory subunit [Lachnospiraceae bacterium]
MKQQLLHTPEGVRDIYNGECERKLVLQENLYNALKKYGYHSIETPTFEFFDIFGKEIGTIPSKELYKFFDREGNTLVLRPDITPSIARCAVKYFGDENMPIRLCYIGNTFINNNSYQGRLKENTQLGAELIGADSVDADAEIIAMAVDCLLTSGLKEFQLGIGHAGFLQGLMETAGLDEETEQELKDLISNKNFFGVEELISKLSMEENLKELFSMLGTFYNSFEDLAKVKELAAPYDKIRISVERLEQLDKVLKLYGIDKYVSYELSVISPYHYYTGIIFSGYTFGSGEPIVKGGRYDNLLTHFGKQSAAIGFAVVVDQLLAALSRQKLTVELKNDTMLFVYDEKHKEQAIEMAMKERKAGNFVELLLHEEEKTKQDYEDYAKRNRRDKITYMIGE